MATSIPLPDLTRGSITCFVGPMFAGKSTAMLAAVTALRLAGRSAVVIVRAGADRAGPDRTGAVLAEGAPVHALAVTHELERNALASAPATGALAAVRVVAAARLADVELSPDELAVGVDEGQFFDDLGDACERWARAGRAVVVAALDGDFSRAPFAPVSVLLPLCDSARVVKIAGVCGDCRSAPSSFSRRNDASRQIVLIGGNDKYTAVCRACYDKSGKSN
jgi:thymidine kinase